MKIQAILFSLSLAAAGIGSAQAQIFRPNAVANGAVLGGIAGAFIGGHNNDRWGQGALIGAAAGALLGAAVEQSRPAVYGRPVIEPVAWVPDAPVAYRAPDTGYVQSQACVQREPRVVYVDAPPPRVVYVRQAPRVVYVRPAPQVVYVAAPSRCATVVVVASHTRRPHGRNVVYAEPAYRRW